MVWGIFLNYLILSKNVWSIYSHAKHRVFSFNSEVNQRCTCCTKVAVATKLSRKEEIVDVF